MDRVKVERVSQVAEIELAEKEKMKDKVRHYCKCTFPFPICTRPNQTNHEINLTVHMLQKPLLQLTTGTA